MSEANREGGSESLESRRSSRNPLLRAPPSRLHRTLAVATLVEKVKSASSLWLKTKSPDLRSFSWQRGYGAFSLSAPELGPLVDYIAGQAQHHKVRCFQDEYRAFLVENGFGFDERYVWD